MARCAFLLFFFVLFDLLILLNTLNHFGEVDVVPNHKTKNKSLCEAPVMFVWIGAVLLYLKNNKYRTVEVFRSRRARVITESESGCRNDGAAGCG